MKVIDPRFVLDGEDVPPQRPEVLGAMVALWNI